MFTRKNLYCLFMVMIFCIIVSSGCGGSSGGSVANNNANQNQNQNNDTNPETPTLPEEPTTPETPTTGYNFSILEGSWTASNGSGTATRTDGTFDLRMVHVNVSLSSVQANGNTATAIASASSEWEAYQNGVYVTSIYSDYSRETVTIITLSANTWRYTLPNGNSTITVTITSSTTAQVTEEGTTSDGYYYSASYTVTKDNPDSPSTYDYSTLQGTWVFSSGRGSATGNGGNYDLVPSSIGTLTISSLQENGDTLTGSMAGTLYWNVYQNGTQVLRAGLQYSRLEARRISGDTWRTIDDNVTITLTSQTTASITEKGTFWAYGLPYQYNIVYTLTKQ